MHHRPRTGFSSCATTCAACHRSYGRGCVGIASALADGAVLRDRDERDALPLRLRLSPRLPPRLRLLRDDRPLCEDLELPVLSEPEYELDALLALSLPESE